MPLTPTPLTIPPPLGRPLFEKACLGTGPANSIVDGFRTACPLNAAPGARPRNEEFGIRILPAICILPAIRILPAICILPAIGILPAICILGLRCITAKFFVFVLAELGSTKTGLTILGCDAIAMLTVCNEDAAPFAGLDLTSANCSCVKCCNE